MKKDGDDWELTFKTSFMNRTTKFTVGVEFEEKNMGGKAIKVVEILIFYPLISKKSVPRLLQPLMRLPTS